MGEVELHSATGELLIRSVFYFYGEDASSDLARKIAEDISILWNEPEAAVTIRKKSYAIRFEITGFAFPDIKPETVWYNDDPKLNFFRIEPFADGDISFVDAIGSNTGYLKTANLLQTPTTAAHEYGHTLGLVHPKITDIRGGAEACIMYPRGSLCDSPMQYDPTAKAGAYGGFLDPKFRKVTLTDISLLRLHKLDFNESGFAQLGEFSSVYHEKQVKGD